MFTYEEFLRLAPVIRDIDNDRRNLKIDNSKFNSIRRKRDCIEPRGRG